MHSRSSVSRDGCEHLKVCQLGLWQDFFMCWLLLNRLKMAADHARIIQNGTMMVVNGRAGTSGLLSNDLADK